MPADGIGAAAETEDFGTSCCQLADQLNVLCANIQRWSGGRKGTAAHSARSAPAVLIGQMSGNGTFATSQCADRRPLSGNADTIAEVEFDPELVIRKHSLDSPIGLSH
jgi:hypothetical protein